MGIKFGFVVALLAFSAVARAEASHIEVVTPAMVDIVPYRVFAPMGFDDNDNVQVVLDGALPNTCYKLGPTEAHVDVAAHKIHLRQHAYYYPGGWCAEVMIPYVQTVSLGILKAGNYELDFERGETLVSQAQLPIAVATSPNPDDFIYAPVTEFQLSRTENAQTRKREVLVSLGGYFSTSCMTFKELKMNVRPNHVIELLPIVEIAQGNDCAEVATEFSIPVSLSNVPPGRYLIHVRSLNGQSLNRVVDL